MPAHRMRKRVDVATVFLQFRFRIVHTSFPCSTYGIRTHNLSLFPPRVSAVSLNPLSDENCRRCGKSYFSENWKKLINNNNFINAVNGEIFFMSTTGVIQSSKNAHDSPKVNFFPYKKANTNHRADKKENNASSLRHKVRRWAKPGGWKAFNVPGNREGKCTVYIYMKKVNKKMLQSCLYYGVYKTSLLMYKLLVIDAGSAYARLQYSARLR